MREIKYRGKAVMTKVELDYQGIPNFQGWVWGNLIKSGDTYYIVGNIIEASEDGLLHEWWTKVYSESVGQFTGLKDKNGMEIYERDIISLTNNTDEVYGEVGQVLWEQSECNFTVQYKAKNPVTLEEYGTIVTVYLVSNETYKNEIEYEVIGNVYENSELLAKQ